MKRAPRVIYRVDDGAAFVRNADDGTYSMKGSMMARPYRYPLATLLYYGKTVFSTTKPAKPTAWDKRMATRHSDGHGGVDEG